MGWDILSAQPCPRFTAQEADTPERTVTRLPWGRQGEVLSVCVCTPRVCMWHTHRDHLCAHVILGMQPHARTCGMCVCFMSLWVCAHVYICPTSAAVYAPAVDTVGCGSACATQGLLLSWGWDLVMGWACPPEGCELTPAPRWLSPWVCGPPWLSLYRFGCHPRNHV